MNIKRRILVGVLVAVMAVFAGISCYLIADNLYWSRVQEQVITELNEHKGEYSENTLVLYNTSFGEASLLAQKYNASLRITKDGKFATLTLPEGQTVNDVFSARENRMELTRLSLDYNARISETEDDSTMREPTRPRDNIADEFYDAQSYLDYININTVWQTTKGNGARVAIIDTGIDVDHPEFKGKISEYSYNATTDKIVKDYTLENGQYDWSLIDDEQGHGTSVAGVIAAQADGNGIVGIAPDISELVIIKAECDESGNFVNTSDLVFGLYYAIECDVQVVNMSFGLRSPVNPFASATQLAIDSDITCVAAAGNDGTAAITYPAADENVIGVGALAENSWELAQYSNYGDNAEIVAPGTTFTTKMNGGYGISTGTSFASPIVAGAVALYYSQNSYAEVAEVRDYLFASGYDLGALGNDWYYGFGALDINALVAEKKGTVTFDMLTDELENITCRFVRGHALQELLEPERNYAVFDGWYYDIHCLEELNWYEDVFNDNITLYANWVNEEDGVPYTYVTNEDGTIEIRSYTGKRKYLTIPETIEDKPVTAIGDSAFAGQNKLREVTLPNTLETIGRNAFGDCSQLLGIEIPQSVTSIGEEAFKDNIRLSFVGFSANSTLTDIGDGAFSNCCSLTNFELPASVETVNGSAFLGDTSLKSITVVDGNKNFRSQDGVLFNATMSKLVAYPAGAGVAYEIPSSVRSVEMYAFAYARLSQIDLGPVTELGDYAFTQSALKDVNIPNGVVKIGQYAFAYNFNLINVVLGGGLAEIPGFAFAYCSYLTQINIPANIKTIDAQAFASSGIVKVEFAPQSSLTVIGGGAFTETPVNAINLPQSLMSIGAEAFKNCTALSDVSFAGESALQIIGDSAFRNCVELCEISLPQNLRALGDYAFSNSGLGGETEIPASLEYFGAGAFAYTDVTAFNVAAQNKTFISLNGVVYTADKTVLTAYPTGNTQTEYNIEGGTLKVSAGSFEGAENLQTVNITEGVSVIEKHAFDGCINASSYILPQSLEEINEYAFSNNSRLDYLDIPDSVIMIGRYAFSYDYSLSSIRFTQNSKLPRISYGAFAYTGLSYFTVPANVSTIAQGAFTGSALYSVTFAKNSKLESISAYMFDGCDNLQYITFESGSALNSIQAHGLEGMSALRDINFGNAPLKTIDNYAFRYDYNLTTLDLPETVKEIGRFAFFGCTDLQRLDIPQGIERVGRYAFHGASELNVYFESNVLPVGLQENWDYGIKGYYVGVSDVTTGSDGLWDYAVMTDGGISIIKYHGEETRIDLSSLVLGEVVSIGGYAFYNTPVTEVILPDTLQTIQNYAFAYSKIQSVTIPNSVNFIGGYAFYHTPLAELTFAPESSVVTIEQYAFADCTALNPVTLPASVEVLGSGVFENSDLPEITFDKNSRLAQMPSKAFHNSKLTKIEIPDSVTYIGDDAFRGCTDLTVVVFGAGEGLQIRSNAFYDSGVTSVTIPANMEYIGDFALVGLRNLKEFNVDAGNKYYSSYQGLLYNKDQSKLIAVPAAKTGVITLPATLEVIGFGAFENSQAEEIVFDKNANILSFGNRAFYGADKLKQITVPASVVAIDYYAFAMCSSLQTVIFESNTNLKGIYEGAFYGCENLQNIVLPDSVREISNFAFYGCAKLTQIPVSENSLISGIYDYAFAHAGLSGDFTLPETVVDIGDYAFLGNNFTSVTIPQTNAMQMTIGIGAFAECNQISSITVPFIGARFEDDQITWFGYIFGAGSYEANAAYVPQSLKTVTIPEGITFVGTGAFYNLASLQTINVPHSVCMLYYHAFGGTTARYELTNTIALYTDWVYDECFGKGISGSLTFAEGITQIDIGCFQDCIYLTEVKLPIGVKDIGAYAFDGCSNLQNINLPLGLTSIGEGAFISCTSLLEIDIPDGITNIPRMTFGWCKNLRRIELPESLISIDEDNAFINCSSLHKIINHSNLPLELGSYDYGDIALYALLLIDKDGNMYKRDGVLETVETSNGFRFTKDETGYTLVAYFGKEQTVTLPLNFNGEPYKIYQMYGVKDVIIPEGFTIIGDNAFSDCESLTSIELPQSLIKIGKEAFFGCISLKSIKIPEGVEIGREAFHACSSLTSVEIPNNITSIREYAFSSCSSLTSIKIPEGVTTIGGGAFDGCSGLTNIELPQSLVSIDYTAFSNCTSLKGIEIPDGVTSIGGSAFAGCRSLVSIELPQNLSTIGEYSFYNCANLQKMNISKNVKVIGEMAFTNCPLKELIIDSQNEHYMLEDGVIYNKAKTEIVCITLTAKFITIPAAVNKLGSIFRDNQNLISVEFEQGSVLQIIDDYAFAYCSNLTKIELPQSLTTIGEHAFTCCSNLTSIELPQSLTTIEDSAFSSCSSLRSIYIPESVTEIGYHAFEYCSNLTEIELPQGLITIGYSVFSGCSSLTSIDIPESVFAIHFRAFSGCSSLTSIKLPQSLTTIDDSAFEYCINLQKVDIHKNVEFIGDNAFINCPLEELTIANQNEHYMLEDGVIYNKAKTEIIWVAPNIKSIIIPATVNDFGEVFRDHKNLISAEFEQGSGIQIIGEWAFENCSSLTSIKLPQSLTTIEYGAFYGCSNLTNIIIPERVTSIENQAFMDCDSLLSVYLPESLLSIGDYAFSGCRSMYKVENKSSLPIELGKATYGEVAFFAKILIDNEGNEHYAEGTSEFLLTPDDFLFEKGDEGYLLRAYIGNDKTVTLPLTVNGEEYKIDHMVGVRDVIIPEGITKIDQGAFEYCSSLTSVIISEGITKIDKMAFEYCSSLTSIIIPKSVKEIGWDAFYKCTNLSDITIMGKNVKIGQNVFYDTAYYNNPQNWIDGVLYIGDCVIKVDDSVEQFTLTENLSVAYDAFNESYRLKKISLGGEHDYLLSGASNLETLIITDLPTEYIDPYSGYQQDYMIQHYFGYSGPLTLKNIVLKKGVKINPWAFSGISNVTIYVEDTKQNTMWDEMYPGWNYGNRVYYGDEWISAEFYGLDGQMLDYGYYTHSQVIHIPSIAPTYDEQYKHVLVGWDINNDGQADFIPATSVSNIVARAVIVKELRQFTVNFYDKDGTTLLQSSVLPYGSEITPPEPPQKQGYTFVEWRGYKQGMTVTGDVNIYSVWEHGGNGHVYGEPVWVEATCTDGGYYKHTCEICGEWYATDNTEANGHSFDIKTVPPTCIEQGYEEHKCSVCGYIEKSNFTDPAGHKFEGWITENEATCTTDGSHYRECSECGEREDEIIPKTGHTYVAKQTKVPTCEEFGEMTYTCESCNDEIKEPIEKTAHNYVKEYVDYRNFWEWLVDKLIDFFFGYDNGRPYYFKCTECGQIQTVAEANSYGASAQSTCIHQTDEWSEELAPTCLEAGISGLRCKLCGELISARPIEKVEHKYSDNFVTDKEPTCTETGVQSRHCVWCDEAGETKEIPATGHKLTIHQSQKDATCAEDGNLEYWQCEVCNKYFKDSQGEQGYEQDGWKLNATGQHTASEDWKIDTDKGTHYHECTVCKQHLDETTHVYDKQVKDDHNHWMECECGAQNEVTPHAYNTPKHDTDHHWNECECGAKDNEIAHTYTIPQKDSDYHWNECECGQIDQKIPHDYKTQGKDEHNHWMECECGAQNEVTPHTYNIPQHDTDHHWNECECGAKDNEVAHTYTIPQKDSDNHWNECECGQSDQKIAHTYTEQKYSDEGHWMECICGQKDGEPQPHASAKGYQHSETEHWQVCDTCNREFGKESHDSNVDIPGEQATCTQKGKTDGKKCFVCGEITVEQTDTEMIPHQMGEKVAYKAATCTEDGNYDYWQCNSCHKYFKDANGDEEYGSNEWIIHAEGHKEEILPGKDATCTESGLTEGKQCTVCGETLEQQEEIPAKGHRSSDWIVDKEAQEGIAGHRHKECLDCGETLEEEDIEALPIQKHGVGCGSVGFGGGMSGLTGLLVVVPLMFIFRRRRVKN